MEVRAPWFRGGTLIGVLVAVGAVVFLMYLLTSRRRARAHRDRAKDELKTIKSAGPPGPAT